ncbi:hypothetical protein PCE1_003124 [Barthelona sp. PCE]
MSIFGGTTKFQTVEHSELEYQPILTTFDFGHPSEEQLEGLHLKAYRKTKGPKSTRNSRIVVAESKALDFVGDNYTSKSAITHVLGVYDKEEGKMRMIPIDHVFNLRSVLHNSVAAYSKKVYEEVHGNYSEKQQELIDAMGSRRSKRILTSARNRRLDSSGLAKLESVNKHITAKDAVSVIDPWESVRDNFPEFDPDAVEACDIYPMDKLWPSEEIMEDIDINLSNSEIKREEFRDDMNIKRESLKLYEDLIEQDKLDNYALVFFFILGIYRHKNKYSNGDIPFYDHYRWGDALKDWFRDKFTTKCVRTWHNKTTTVHKIDGAKELLLENYIVTMLLHLKKFTIDVEEVHGLLGGETREFDRYKRLLKKMGCEIARVKRGVQGENIKVHEATLIAPLKPPLSDLRRIMSRKRTR